MDPKHSNLPEEPSSETSTEGSVSDGGESSHVLVAYFSWADNAILADDVDAVASPSVIPPGNVQQLAGWVQEGTGGDVFTIQVTEPYPSDWDECLDLQPDLDNANVGKERTLREMLGISRFCMHPVCAHFTGSPTGEDN